MSTQEFGQKKNDDSICLDSLEANSVAAYRKLPEHESKFSSRQQQHGRCIRLAIAVVTILVIIGAFAAIGATLSRLETQYSGLSADTEKLMGAKSSNETERRHRIDTERIEDNLNGLSAKIDGLESKINGTRLVQQTNGLRQEEKDQLNARITNLERKINETRKFQQSLGLSREEEVECLEEYKGILYNGSCLWAENITESVSLFDAIAICNNRTKSKLPEVYGGEEYLQIMDYLRSTKKTKDGLAWTAMTRNHGTGNAMMSDGSIAPYQKARTKTGKWDSAEAKRTNVYLVAHSDPSRTDQGMGSIWPEYKASDLLCQKVRP